jgi:hypothetical protein
MAYAKVNGVATVVDTGVAPYVNVIDAGDPTMNPVAYQTFRITLEAPATVNFFIETIDENNNVITDPLAPVASITTNLPDRTRQLSGFGIYTQASDMAPTFRTTLIDYYLYTGVRYLPVETT